MVNKITASARNEMPPDAKALAVSELRYRRLFEAAQDGILILDAETGVVVDVNPFLLDLLGYPYENFVGKAIWDLGFFKDIVANQDNFAELQSNEYIRYDDKPLETATGQRVDVEFVSNVYLVDHKKVIQCNIRDITGRKQAEARQGITRDILHILNESGDLGEALQHVLTILKTRTGFDAAGIRLQDGDDFPYIAQLGFPDEFLLKEASLLARNTNGGICRNPDGTVCLECTCGLVISGQTDPADPFFTKGGSFWTNDSFPLLELPPGEDPRWHPRNECIYQGYASVALIPIKAKNSIIGLIQLNDHRKGCFILETVEKFEGFAAHIGAALLRKQAEEALRASQQLIEGIINTIPVRVFWKDKDLVYLGCNAAFARDAGFQSPKEIIGKDDYQMSWRDQADPYRADDRRVIAGETILDKEEPQTTPERKSNTLLTSKVPLRNSNGEITGILGAYVDITGQCHLEDQLRQAQKMEAIGRLAGGVAHDFNNMLQVILGYTEIAIIKTGPDSPITDSLKQILKAGKNSAALTRQLLTFARKEVIAPEILDLNETLSDMLKMLQRLIGEDIHLVWKPSSALRPIRLDPTQMNQIVANLCINARDAIGGTGQIVLETGNVIIDAAYCSIHAEAAPGAYVCLTVSDNGCGMDRETLANIFEPFFTTKGLGKGTGLGLATVYGIVKQNNGFIYAYSEPGIGTTFRIYLPQVAIEACETVVAEPAQAPEGREETILLVEDEPALLSLCQQFLNELNYTVLTAGTPEEALALFQQHQSTIKLLLTDVIMPGMNGQQLAEKISAAKPDIKVLFMSGYAADVMADLGVLKKDAVLIAKPFTRDELARKTHDLLEAHKTKTGSS